MCMRRYGLVSMSKVVLGPCRVRVYILVVQFATDSLVNNEECLVFLSIYEFFVDVFNLLGDSNRFSGFNASLMATDYAVRNIAKRQDGG